VNESGKISMRARPMEGGWLEERCRGEVGEREREATDP
jgi:hypothetical protein